jgi:hypothetical protein
MRAQYYLPETLESDESESGWADEGWYEESEAYEYLMPLEGEPTHWMPLPPAPDAAPPQRNEPEYRDVVVKGDLWRIEFLPDHAASVVLVKANYEAQSEPKLVAYLRRKEFAFGYEQVDREDHGAIPVYTAPPQREWQGLTDEEIRNEAKNHVFDESFFNGAIWARGQIMGRNDG